MLSIVLALGYRFNPRSPHGERLELFNKEDVRWIVSIHAPHTGSDCICSSVKVRFPPFQSTLPTRGATIRAGVDYFFGKVSIHAPHTGSDRSIAIRWLSRISFNPRSPHGERRFVSGQTSMFIEVSIHAPHTGSDNVYNGAPQEMIVSIHAPHTGSDHRNKRGCAL